MALTSTTYAIELELADMDRHVYVSESFTLACHPSETTAFLVTRLLAYALEHTEGIAFSRGLSVGEEPALWVHDLTGRLTAWIEVGAPAPSRLHQAAKAVGQVAVYCHKDTSAWLARLRSEHVHGTDHIRLFAVDRDLIAGLEGALARRNKLSLSVTEGTIYAELNGVSLSGTCTPLSWT